MDGDGDGDVVFAPSLIPPLILRHSARAEWLEWRKGWLQTERRLPPPECLIGERM